MNATWTKLGAFDFTYEPVDPDTLHSTDLLENSTDSDVQAFAIHIGAQVEGAEALWLPSEGRTGIAWGADATWFDSFGNIETDIDFWLNGDPDEIQARN